MRRLPLPLVGLVACVIAIAPGGRADAQGVFQLPVFQSPDDQDQYGRPEGPPLLMLAASISEDGEAHGGMMVRLDGFGPIRVDLVAGRVAANTILIGEVHTRVRNGRQSVPIGGDVFILVGPTVDGTGRILISSDILGDHEFACRELAARAP